MKEKFCAHSWLKRSFEKIRYCQVRTFCRENTSGQQVCDVDTASFIGLEFIKVSYFTFLRVWFHLSVPYLFSNLLCKNIINIYDVELMEYYLYFYFMTYTRVVDTLWNHKTKSPTRSHTAYMIRYVCHGLRRK